MEHLWTRLGSDPASTRKMLAFSTSKPSPWEAMVDGLLRFGQAPKLSLRLVQERERSYSLVGEPEKALDKLEPLLKIRIFCRRLCSRSTQLGPVACEPPLLEARRGQVGAFLLRTVTFSRRCFSLLGGPNPPLIPTRKGEVARTEEVRHGLEARSVSRLFAWAFAIAGCAAVVAAQSDTVAWPHAANRVDPKEFGIQDETITVVSGLSFVPRIPTKSPRPRTDFISPSLAIYCKCFDISQLYEWYAAVAIPPGAVLGYIGVNSMTTVDGVLGAALWERDRDGTLTFRYGFSLPAHNHFNTDLAGPLGIQVPSNLDRETCSIE